MSDARSFVLGLDGVPWRLVERWAAAGDLPNFARLIEEGAAGPLRSTVPANTPVAWPSIATGTWPDQHGVYEFVSLDRSYGQRPSNNTDLRVPALWDLCSPAAVVNVPMTYPAPAIDGRVVAGMMAPSVDSQGFTHPPSLSADLREAVPGYGIGLDWKEYYGQQDRFRSDLRELVAARRESLDVLLSPEDELAFVVFTAPDRLQHLVWDEDVLRAEYRYFDEVVGQVLDRCEREDRRLFVVSDHGFGEIEALVNVNRLLLEAGLFARREDGLVRRALGAVGLSKDRVLAGLERVGITDDWLVATLPKAFVDSVASSVPGDHAVYDMDPTRTEAFLHGLGSVYVNDTERFDPGCVPPERVDAVKTATRQVLEDLRDPDTGRRALDVYDGAEQHPRDPFAPDLVVEGRDPYRVTSSLHETVFADPGGKVADHRPEGILLAWGPEIEPGATPRDASVVDVAPTVLHAAGLPIPEHVDGRVLEELFPADSGPATRAVEYASYDRESDRDVAAVADDGDDAVEERLRGLGYID